MKKSFLVLVLSIATITAAFGQKGNWYVLTSGMVTDDNPFTTGIIFTTENYGEGVDYKTMTMALAPEAGYFISNKFSVGLGLAFGYSEGKPDIANAEKTTTTIFGINPYVRWYPYNEKSLSFYLQGGLSYLSATEKFMNVKTDLSSFSIGINPGIGLSLTKHFGINAAFGFLGYQNMDLADGLEANQFGLKLDASTLKFGVSYTF